MSNYAKTFDGPSARYQSTRTPMHRQPHQAAIWYPAPYHRFHPESACLGLESRYAWRVVMACFQNQCIRTTFLAIDFEGPCDRVTQVGMTQWHMHFDGQTPIWDSFLWTISENIAKNGQLDYRKFQTIQQQFKPSAEAIEYKAESTHTDRRMAATLVSLKDCAGGINDMITLIRKLDRDIVLVLHGGQNDRRSLRNMGVNMEGLHILDTQILEWDLAGHGPKKNLEHCLDRYRIRHDRILHNAGNDCYYTMALLHSIATCVVSQFGGQGLEKYGI